MFSAGSYTFPNQNLSTLSAATFTVTNYGWRR